MKIKQFTWNIVDSNSWLITEENHGLLIDAIDSEDLYETLEPLETVNIIITHAHFDHIYGLNRIKELKPGAVVYATKQCSLNIGNKYKNMSASANAFMAFYKGKIFSGNIDPMVCAPAEKIFEGSMNFQWQKHELKLEAYYGHSNDSMIAVIDDKYMFSGDTILAIPTVTRFPGGSTTRFWQEDIKKLETMKMESVFPGHGMAGSLENMLAVNRMPEKYR